MADYITQPHTHRTPSAGQAKRNSRNRRNNQQHFQGAVSDGAIANPAASPTSHKTRQSVVLGAEQPVDNMSRSNAQRQRPSSGGGLTHGTPAKEQAYAGPTFQASPAAASLPVPKFFSKSVPNAAQHTTLQARLEREKANQTVESSPESDSAAPVPPPPREESPLDFFFEADRAEKEKSRSNSNALSPQAATRQPPSTVPRNMFHGKSLFLQELDGDTEGMPSPRTLPPKSRPGPGDRSHSSPGAQQHTASDDERQAYTKNLKELLFNTARESITPPRSQTRPNSSARTPDGVFGSPSPMQRPSSGPSTPQPAAHQQQNQHALHYGNRNLSPLFKAARGDTPTRPSSLRQEMINDSPSSRAYPPSNYQTYQSIPPSTDTNTLARSYLKEQIRTSAPAEMPQLPFGAQPNGVSYGTAGSVPSSDIPRSGGAHDIRGMENDLRRMLKLNVLG